MSTYKIKDFIKEINIRNTNNIYSNVLGINIDKYFFPTIATLIKADLSKYKIISNNQFAFNAMHVGRDKKLPIARYKQNNHAIVSPAYCMFEIDKPNLIKPEYFELLYKQAKFDYRIWLLSNNGIRGSLNFNDFSNLEIEIPSLDIQQHIVDTRRCCLCW